MTLQVAIVGSGPSGFYAADALLRLGDARIDLIERLPTPFGLIRGGVAPDHQSTKRVSRSFEKTALATPIAYFGNVEIGRDLTMEELRGLYDVVILAVGAPRDRPLDIPGADKAGVIGSAAFVGWYNGHPDFHDLDPSLDSERVVVIGNGNVALDIARVLVKTPEEMAVSDISEQAGQAIAASPIREVVLLGRRGPVEAKFSQKELREMGSLAAARPLVDPADLEQPIPPRLSERARRVAERNLAILSDFAQKGSAAEAESRPKRVVFRFFAQPVEVAGGAQVSGLLCERTRVLDGRVEGTGERITLDCGLVIPAIGYRSIRIPGVPYDAARGRFRNRDGRIAEGLYCVGWCKRGPVGVIGTSKADGEEAALAIRKDFTNGAGGGKPGRDGLESLLRGRETRWVDYEQWAVIDKAEQAAAAPGAPRRKFVTVADMLALLEDGARNAYLARD